jgi:hypothetical protein
MGGGGEAIGENRQILGVKKVSFAVLSLDQASEKTRFQGIRQSDALDAGEFEAPASQSTPSANVRGQA